MERSHQNLCLANPDGLAQLVASQSEANSCKEQAEIVSTVKATIRRAAEPKDQPPSDPTINFFASEGNAFVGRFRQLRATDGEQG